MRTSEVLLSEEQGTEQHCAISFSARRICVSRPVDFDAGRRRTFSMVQKQLGASAPTIVRCRARFLRLGMDGRETHHPGQSASVLTPALRAKIHPGQSPGAQNHLGA
jgi:hypothetical protein